MQEITSELIADKFVWSVWDSVSRDYKQQYARDIWNQFENALRSASYTDSLKVFLTNFQKRIPAEIKAEVQKDIVEVINLKKDEKVLNILRNETTYLVMLARIRNQERKEAFLEKHGSELKQSDEINFMAPMEER
jgi:molybdopterin converting factor small subunit